MFKFFYLTSSLFLFTELYTCIILLFGIFCIFSMCCRNYSSSCSPSRSYSRSVSRSRSRRRESRSPSIRRRKGSPSHLDKRRITRWGGGILCVYQLIFLLTFGIMRILKTFDNNEYQNESLKYKLNVMYEKKPSFLIMQ